jgi:hypothetical protein
LETLREPEAGGPEQRFDCGGVALREHGLFPATIFPELDAPAN